MRLTKPTLEEEAKAIVLLAFRNGPIEDIHAPCTPCPNCGVKRSRITEEEMKDINRTAVNRVWMMLRMREQNPQRYRACVQYTCRSLTNWDPPKAEEMWEESCELMGKLLIASQEGTGRRPGRGR